ncbi:MAG TPA: carboxypeptidase regulatory-like domain-containing protein [Blastocatellia bacterium]|nr:carboxypeptidase regulatory-like domain-containing protein [Blastocatellia bacterium]
MSRIKPFHSLGALLLALCLGLSSVTALAQSQASTGQIAGAVVDNQGAIVANASIKAVNTQTGLERTVSSGDDGLYTILLLPPGVYRVTATAQGFSAVTVDNVEVAVGRTIDVKITLGVSGVQEVVNVTAGSIQVQTTRSEADAVVNQRAIENLPINGRRFQDFVTLTPAAQVDPRRQQISLSGQLGIHTNVSIDGADYNNPFFGGIRGGERSNNAYTVPQESIKEFQVVASGYTAEFGRSTGGIVNAVTKSGTNDIHGSGFYLYRPKDLSRGNDFTDAVELSLRNNLLPGQSPREITVAPTQHQWGGSIGGPIKKDKLFFFGAYEQQRVRQGREVFFDAIAGLTSTPTIAEGLDFFHSLEGPFQQTNDAISFLGRVDYMLSDRHNLNVRYSYSHNEAQNAVSNGVPLFPTITNALSNNGTELDTTNTVVGQFTSILSPSLVNEFRGQYSRENRPRPANAQEPLVSTLVGNFGTVSFLGQNEEHDWRAQVIDNITWTRGAHSFKLGGEYNHVFAAQTFGFNQYGAFTVSGSTASNQLDTLSFTPGSGVIGNRFDAFNTSGVTVRYSRQIGNLQATLPNNEAAVFAQDSWRMRPNFTLNYGLRWEGQWNPQPELGNTALINLIKGFRFPSGHVVDPTVIPNDLNNVGPRLGFAWDPWSDGKTVIRGYSGIYYSRTPALLFAAPINNFRDPAGDLSVTLPFSVPAGNPNTTVYKQLKLIGIDLNNFPLNKLPVISVDQIRQLASQLGIDPLTAGLAPILMANDFQNPTSVQYGIGIEREVNRSLTIGADFSYVHTTHLQQNRDINLPLPIIRPVANDPSQRPFFGLSTPVGQPFHQDRPIPTLNSVQIRESTGKSLFRALTLRAKFQRRWGQFNVFYVRSKALSSVDNEREAGGVLFENAFNTDSEYSLSNLDIKHQFVANPVFFLPLGIDVASAIRLRSGRPFDARMGSDVNQDATNLDRPYRAPGIPFERNAFRNRPVYNVDMRVQKRFQLGESRRLLFSAEFFNIFNIANIELAGSQVGNFCASTSDLTCGFTGPTNPNFLSLYENGPTSTRRGALLLNNNPGPPFQVQLGARFQF